LSGIKKEETNIELESDILMRLTRSWAVGWESLRAEISYEVHGLISSNIFTTPPLVKSTIDIKIQI
jgi:hypothetical protein